MAGLNHAIISSFGISGKFVREKGSYRTADKRYLLQKTNDNPSKISGYYQIKQHTKNRGFVWLDNQYLTKDGLPYVQADGFYIMTDYIDAPEFDFSAPEFLQAVEAAAHFHSCAREVRFGKTPPKPGICLIDEYSAAIADLERFRKMVRKQSKLSDFDVLFIKHFEEYLAAISSARAGLINSRYAEYRALAIQNAHIRHGNLKEETLRKKGEHIYISKFSDCTLDYQLKDLAALIVRHKKKGGSVPPEKIIAAYENRLPLLDGEEAILEAMLSYPGAFVKIVGEYYNKKRNWTPVFLMNGLTEILRPESDAYTKSLSVV